MTRRSKLLPFALATLAALSACSSSSVGGNGRSISSGAARYATYEGIAEAGGPVTLVDGRWEGPAFQEGGASRPRVRLLEGLALEGDVGGDGSRESVVLLTASAGGSGESLYLAALGTTGKPPKAVDTARIGDRVDIRSGRIEGGQVVLDIVQAGANDPSCCPGDLVTRTWDLRSGKPVEGPPVTTGRLSPESLAGPEWVLERWGDGEPAPPDPAVTLHVVDGQVSGSSGCNRYTAAIRPGDLPGSLEFGPVAGTRRMCEGPSMDVEERFLAQLGGVRSFRFVLGRLGLEYEVDGKRETMLFRPESPR